MIGVDTNLLVRHIVADDARQAKLADAFLKKHCTPEDPGHVNLVVLCELAWTLDRTYGYSRADIARVIDGLLITRELMVENRDVVVPALHAYRHTALGFSDALIGAMNRAAGCAVTATFDRRAARADGFTLVG